MPTLIRIIICVATISACTSQTSEQAGTVSSEGETADYLENRAHPVGWPASTWEVLVNDYMVKNMKYPENAKAHGVKGDVRVRFTVLEDGSLSNFRVTKGLGYGCDEEAIRLIKSIGQWSPHIMNGEAKRSDLVLQVFFAK